jgi:hypothetical protein
MSNSSNSPRPRLTAEDAALLTAYLIHLYETEKGKEISRFRLSRDSVRRLGLRLNLREAFTAEWAEAMASDWGWIAFAHREEFGLIRISAVSGWVRLGTKRVSEDLRRLRRGDCSVLTKIRDVLAQLPTEEDEDEE